VRHSDGDPCTAAEIIALDDKVDRAVVSQCHVDGLEVTIQMRGFVDLPFHLHYSVYSVARAGLA
jgi:hypothetical protein